MDKVLPDTNENQTEDESNGHEQFPVDTHIVTKVRLDTNGADGDFIRIVVMNDQATAQCSAYREYNYGNTDVSIESITAFTMRSGTIAGTQQEIDGFVGSMSLQLNIPQPTSFSRGVYSPSAERKRLYKAADPDDSTKMIGLLLEQDSQGRLTQITWYKTQDARSLFHSTPDSLDFELVKSNNSAPSLDPNDIGGWTWYYTTSFGNCSVSQRITA